MAKSPLPVPDGLLAVVKADCPTCQLVVPVLEQLARGDETLTVLSQDDPDFPRDLEVVDDSELELSYRLDVEAVPTLYRLSGGQVQGQAVGWNRQEWQELTGAQELGTDLPASRPGCGSRSVEPGVAERLRQRFDGTGLVSRQVELGELEDPVEACFSRGWTDGLPVVPPTAERVERMLAGTTRPRDEVLGQVPPDYAECTVEKVAVNAVMAGCLPEYLPLVLATVEAALEPAFNWHGLAATTYFSGPVVIVNGPICQRIGMNSGMNALGQGNRANATVGRALHLVLRNVGGARPGEVDRATLGNPGKYTFCFAEDEAGSPWTSLAVERGVAAGSSAVTLFAGEGPRGVIDQLSRTPESLARSLAGALRTVAHPKLVLGFDAFVVVSPEHGRVFRQAGWSKDQLRGELMQLLTSPGKDLVRGSDGCSEGVPETLAGADLPKFRPDGLWFVHAGGKAGLFSAIIGGWINGEVGSQPVTKEVTEP